MTKAAAYRLAHAFQGRLRAYASPREDAAPAGLRVTRH